MNPLHDCKPNVETRLSTMKHWNYTENKTTSQPCISKTGTWFWCRVCEKPVFVEVKF